MAEPNFYQIANGPVLDFQKPSDIGEIVRLRKELQELKAKAEAPKKHWYSSLTVQMVIALAALFVAVLVGEYGGWEEIGLQVLNKILIDSFAAAVLVPMLAGGAIFGRIRKGDLGA